MKTMILDIDGMSCDHCVRHVSGALQALPGVSTVTVDLESGQATLVVGDGFSEDAARDALDDAGYELAGSRAA